MVEAPAQRKFIVGGNWKSNGSVDFVRTMCTDTLNKMEFDQDRVEVVIAPIMLHITSLKTMLNSNILVASQNISAEGKGAFTGEIAPAMLVDIGCRSCILGHSERRTLFGETDAIVNTKTKAALAAGLTPIVCVGETLEEREQDRTATVVTAMRARCFS